MIPALVLTLIAAALTALLPVFAGAGASARTVARTRAGTADRRIAARRLTIVDFKGQTD